MGIVTPQTVQRVARLARLQLEGQALAQMAAQLDEILEYMQQLQAVPTDQVEPTSHVVPLANVLRKDERRVSLKPEAVLALAPAAHPPFVKVPKVIDV